MTISIENGGRDVVLKSIIVKTSKHNSKRWRFTIYDLSNLDRTLRQ